MGRLWRENWLVILLIGVMVDEPQGAIYGGVVAAPAFGKIASFALPYMRIPPQ